MRTAIAAIGMALALATTPVSLAQRAQQAQPAPQTPAPQTTVTDEEIETFATIYVDLLDTAAKFEAELQSAQTEEQALAIRERVEAESIAKVAQRGWTPEKFNSVGDAINRDPALTEKAVKAIEAK
jgi:hypothetical protein